MCACVIRVPGFGELHSYGRDGKRLSRTTLTCFPPPGSRRRRVFFRRTVTVFEGPSTFCQATDKQLANRKISLTVRGTRLLWHGSFGSQGDAQSFQLSYCRRTVLPDSGAFERQPRIAHLPSSNDSRSGSCNALRSHRTSLGPSGGLYGRCRRAKSWTISGQRRLDGHSL